MKLRQTFLNENTHYTHYTCYSSTALLQPLHPGSVMAGLPVADLLQYPLEVALRWEQALQWLKFMPMGHYQSAHTRLRREA